jgi:hypothetical protein
MGLPQVLQNVVAKLRAWGRSKRTTDASPRSHRSAAAFTITSQECAVPVAFRHREQWQFRKRSNGPSTSNATSPHMQLPRNIAILVSSPGTCRAQRLPPPRVSRIAGGSHLRPVTPRVCQRVGSNARAEARPATQRCRKGFRLAAPAMGRRAHPRLAQSHSYSNAGRAFLTPAAGCRAAGLC